MKSIPLVNLEAQYKKLKPEVLKAIESVLESHSFIQGKEVAAFEREMIECHDALSGVGCSNGTAAISLALEALGVGRDDEVITSAHTFIASAESICAVGAKPVFVDIDPRTYALDIAKVREAITPKTRAIIPVHIYGTPCDMDPLMELAREKNLFVIEDAAQAHLATYKGKYVGTFGDAAGFSFYPGKNLGAYGDAGFIFARDKSVRDRMKQLLDHGRINEKYRHDIVGYNQRMDEIQAAVLRVKLRYLKEWTDARRRNAALYRELLKDSGVQFMEAPAGADPVYHLFVVQVSNRDEVMSHLKQNGIASGIHYPIPLHLQPAFSNLGYSEGAFPVCERAAKRIISLPLCPELTSEDIETVCRHFKAVARA
jgi:dTDP-4-amino-4,6-dideoxygalactose transaminase